MVHFKTLSLQKKQALLHEIFQLYLNYIPRYINHLPSLFT